MTLSIGRKVVYPGHGPCRVGAVVKKIIGGQLGSYYRLVSLAETSDAVFVPVNKTDGLGIRRLITKSEVSRLLRHLALPPQRPTRWKEREYLNLKRWSSGSADDLARIIECLTELNERRPLAPGERNILDRARRLLICEISEATGENKQVTERYLDSALGMHRGHS